MKYANLHLHSIFSDGQMTPQQLVLIGKSMDYRALALTDHCTDGGVSDFFKAARLEGIDAISGVEFDGPAFGVNFHIVALDFDRDEKNIRAFIKRLCEERTEYTRKGFELALEKGILHDISWNDILDASFEDHWICPDFVINVMKQKKVMERFGGDVDYRAFCRTPEVKQFSPTRPAAEEIIKTIRGAGGIAVLAHPNMQVQYVGKLVDMGLNGIEISHPHLYEGNSKLALRAAEAYNLYRSGGTDHTGVMSGCDRRNAVPALNGITEEEYMIIKERRLG